jgi:hypothetical protein
MTGFDATPHFDKAEYLGEPSADHCVQCQQPMVGVYYRVNGAMTCPAYAVQARSAIPKGTHATFMCALLFGSGGALLGLILYSAFGIITGLVIGYLSLAVGYIVAKAMMMGSRGIGGRRYQIAAVLLTYAAVSLSAIPIGISVFVKQKGEESERKRTAAAEQRRKIEEEQKQFEQEFGTKVTAPVPAPSTDQPHAAATTPAPAAKQPRPSLASALGYVALMGLASPFLDLREPVQGFIGLIILLVGIRIAWRMTAAKESEIIGPFRSGPSTA